MEFPVPFKSQFAKLLFSVLLAAVSGVLLGTIYPPPTKAQTCDGTYGSNLGARYQTDCYLSGGPTSSAGYQVCEQDYCDVNCPGGFIYFCVDLDYCGSDIVNGVTAIAVRSMLERRLMFKRLLIPGTVILAVGALSFLAARRAGSQTQSHKAFTAFQIEKRYDSSGAERYEEHRLYAVRADGSSVLIKSRPGPDGKLYRISDMYNVPDGRVISVDGFTESTVTKNLGEGELAFRKQIDRSCLQATEHTSMLGRDVVKVHGVQGPSERSSESTE